MAQMYAFPDCKTTLNQQMTTQCCIKLEIAYKLCSIVFKVIHLIKMKQGPQITVFTPKLSVPGVWLYFEITDGCKMMQVLQKRCPIIFLLICQFFRSHEPIKISTLALDLSVSGWQLQSEFMDGKSQTASESTKEASFFFHAICQI